MTYYTIKTNSPEGKYYLVNKWDTYKKYWRKPGDLIYDGMLFKRPGDAKRSLTKLLKLFPEYLYDPDTEQYSSFEMVEIFIDTNPMAIKETKLYDLL